MWLKRRKVDGARCVGFTHAGGQACAALLSLPEGRQPKVEWVWEAPADDLAAAVAGLRHARRSARLPGTLVLDRGQYNLLSVDAPDIPRAEWADALRWQLKEQVEYPIEDAVISVLAIPSDTQARASNAAIVLTTSAEQAQRQYLVADNAGHAWRSVEVPESALRNISALVETADQAHALMVFGPQYGMLVITYRGELLMARTIEVVVSSVAGSDEARSTALGRAGLEVLRTLDTFERLHSQVSLSGLTVALPQGAEGLTEVLSDLIYVPVKQLRLDECLDLSAVAGTLPELGTTPSFEQLCAVGAALHPLQERQGRQLVNLHSEAYAAVQVPWSAALAVKVGGGMLGVTLAAGAALNAWGARMQAELSTLPPPQAAAVATPATAGDAGASAPAVPAPVIPKPPALIEIEALRQTQEQQVKLRNALISAGNTAGGQYSEYLRALSRQAPGALWITRFIVHGDTDELEITGRMTEPTLLPAYLARLEQEPRFKGRRFTQMEVRALGGDVAGEAGLTEFTLKGRNVPTLEEAAGAKP